MKSLPFFASWATRYCRVTSLTTRAELAASRVAYPISKMFESLGESTLTRFLQPSDWDRVDFSISGKSLTFGLATVRPKIQGLLMSSIWVRKLPLVDAPFMQIEGDKGGAFLDFQQGERFVLRLERQIDASNGRGSQKRLAGTTSIHHRRSAWSTTWD